MSVHLTLIILAAFANLVLGAAVLFRSPRGLIHRYFAFFSWAVASWTLSNGLVSAFAESNMGYLWARLAFASATLIPMAFLKFASVFPTPEPAPSAIAMRVLMGTGAVTLIASLTSLIVRQTTSANGRLQVDYGPLHLPFAVYFVISLGFSLFLLTQKLLRLKGIQQLQVRYLFIAVLTSAAGAVLTNLIVPIVFHTSQFSPYGPLFGILMVAVIAHAIVRHRLLDIRVVIRQGVVYICAIGVAGGSFFLLAESFKRLKGYNQSAIPFVEALFLAVVVAIFFQPLKAFVQTSLNTYFYRRTYDYERTLREASRRLSTTLELHALLDYLAQVIDSTLKVDGVLICLKDQATNHFAKALARGSLEGPTPKLTDSFGKHIPLINFLSSSRETLVRDDASQSLNDPDLGSAARDLATLGGDVAFPILDDHVLVGIVVIGAKRSGDPFFSNDLDLLATLIGQAALTMKNVHLYQQVVLINEYVENILRTMDSGVITVDHSGSVALCNSTAARLTGLSREHLTSLNVDTLPSPLGSQLHQTLTDGSSRSQFETALPGEGDRRTPLVCSTSALRDERSTVIGALIVFSDLSKIKALENEKRTAERLASLGSLVSGIAHEIKNPLVAIKTFAELLPERYSDTDFRDDFSKVVRTEIDRIDGLVGRLRGLAAPKAETEASTDIRGPISETLSLLRGKLEQMQITVQRDLGSLQALVSIDPDQAKQLFLNLFLNAIEAMTPGGQLGVSVVRLQRQGQPWIRIATSDTGPGIPDVIRAKIFDPFFTTKAKGSGLGLAICRSIVDAHRGTIRAEMITPGAGTTILVEFPGASVQAQVAERSAVLR
jgi:PAS domain S-box-containing protein